jgi:hypothetical protein
MGVQEVLPVEGLELKPQQAITPMQLLALAAQNGATIDVVERLAALQEKQLAREAELLFFQALHAAQQEVPSIEPNKEVKTGGGKLMYKYASYEQLDKALRPIYIKHGMAISFSGAEAPAGKVRVLCCVSHRDGHAERYQLDLAIDQGAAQLTKTDAELGAQSKAKRRILRNIFNIVDDLEDEAVAANGEVAEWVGFIKKAATPEEVRTVFTDYYKHAQEEDDRKTMHILLDAKDARLKELRNAIR